MRVQYTENGINLGDTVKGTVNSNSCSGIYLTLENGEGAYAAFGGLRIGTEVLCTAIRPANDRYLMRVAIDTVLPNVREAA